MELKFRAWNKYKRTMEYFDNLYWFKDNDVNNIINTNYEIMLCANIHDKKGTSLYSGDISIDSLGLEWLTLFNKGGFNFYCVSDIGEKLVEQGNFGSEEIKWFETEHTIIGNMYHNPEILVRIIEYILL